MSRALRWMKSVIGGPPGQNFFPTPLAADSLELRIVRSADMLAASFIEVPP